MIVEHVETESERERERVQKSQQPGDIFIYYSHYQTHRTESTATIAGSNILN